MATPQTDTELNCSSAHDCESANEQPRSAASDDENTANSSAVMTAFCIDKTSSTSARLRTDVPRPVPLAHEALIRVLRAGICGTDLAMMNDYKPGFEGALGHEFVGVVGQVGNATDATRWLGKRVVGEINIPCDDATHCRVCRVYHGAASQQQEKGPKATSGGERDINMLYRNHCPHRHALGIVGRSGAFAEFITLPLANLLVVPDCVSDSDAVFTEPLAAAYRIVEQHEIQTKDEVAVLGDGRLGLLVAEVIAIEKIAKSVTLIGKHADKLALLTDVVDKTVVYGRVLQTHDGSNAIYDPQAFDELHSEKFNVVVECTGTTSGISSALRMVRPHGRIIMKSTCSQPRTEISPETFAMAAQKSVAIVGSRCGPFHPALAALADKRVVVAKYLAATYPLASALEAIAHAGRRGTLKVQLDLTAYNQ